MSRQSPNVVLVFGDQWRSQAFGYAGDPNVRTPHIDSLAAESANFVNAVANIPVCTPARACLLTGQYPLTHGVFVNDVHLSDDAVSIANAFAAQGYDTAYIGKWHVDGHGRHHYIPPHRRQGFDYWKVLECTHDYNDSPYYAGDSDEALMWEEYDAIAQTKDAQRYIRERSGEKPFLLVLSWGPPHNPYETAPEQYRQMYRPEDIELRPNVPAEMAGAAREWLAGYYAHCTALDDCVRDLRRTLDEQGLADDTIFLFFSDHGDMLGSHGMERKQKPWEESASIPFLLHYPALLGKQGRTLEAPIEIVDIMPTLMGLAGLPIPESVEGRDYAGYISGGDDPSDGAALIACYHAFGEWHKGKGGQEYRALRTGRYTYARNLAGPWLLYDNERDPYQLRNLIDDPEYSQVQAELDTHLQRKLAAQDDAFLPGEAYIEQWGYPVDETGTVPYHHKFPTGL